MPRALLVFVVLLFVGCGSAAPLPQTAQTPAPEPPPDWQVRACGAPRAWDGLDAFTAGALEDGTPFVPAPLITDRPLEIALLREVVERDRVALRLVLLRCEEQRWVEHAKIDLGAGDRTLSRGDRQLRIEPLAFGDRMATLIRVSERASGWLVLLDGDRNHARAVVAQPVAGEPLAFLAPHHGGVALATVRERNGRIEGRVLAVLDAHGADADAPDALWSARVRSRPALCARDDLRCYPVCGDIHLVTGWPRAEDVPLASLGTAPTLIWLGRGAPPAAPAPLATVRPGLDGDGEDACVF